MASRFLIVEFTPKKRSSRKTVSLSRALSQTLSDSEHEIRVYKARDKAYDEGFDYLEWTQRWELNVERFR